MLNVSLICVGKLKEKFYLAAAEEYQKRLSARSCRRPGCLTGHPRPRSSRPSVRRRSSFWTRRPKGLPLFLCA